DVKLSSLAVASIRFTYLGIVVFALSSFLAMLGIEHSGIVPLASLAFFAIGLVFGIVALCVIRRHPGKLRGIGLAIAAIIVSFAVFSFVSTFIFVARKTIARHEEYVAAASAEPHFRRPIPS
ncbi:MAG: hypothetical protein ACYSWP_13330, partial [Planctomycetota bacterium]